MGRKLGEGQAGDVYEAYDPLLDRHVALKRAKPSSEEDGIISSLRFQREQTLAGLLKHPNIVPIYDGGSEGDRGFIVMELMEGGTLDAELRGGKPMLPMKLIRFMEQILDAIAHAHDRGIVHRDLKPGNILLTMDGTLRVADFGIARTDGSLLTEAGIQPGTPSYMSPEQIKAEVPIDRRADLWAVGVLLYQCLTGQKPFKGSNLLAVIHSIMHSEPAAPSKIVPGLSPAFDAIVRVALSKDRDKRFIDADAFKSALQAAMQVSTKVDGTSFEINKPAPTQPLQASQMPSQGREVYLDPKRAAEQVRLELVRKATLSLMADGAARVKGAHPQSNTWCVPDEIDRRYELRGRLGIGAMGTVYEAMDRVIERRVAIKLVRRPPPGDRGDEEAHARFRREAEVTCRLSHPGIVHGYDYGENTDTAWIVMEFVDGGSLKARFDRGERFPMPEIARLMEQILAALAYSHARGVVHRDIKPADIMLTSDGPGGPQVKIADFGIARLENSSMTQPGTMMGTPSYMAPEQFRGETVDARADLWAAGVVLYQFLTGEKPFEGGLTAVMHKALNTEPTPPSQLSVTAPRSFDAVVARALAKRPEDRFPDAPSFAAAVRTAAEKPR